MKCGLIWARRARSSASMTRVRVRASSASASWLETQAATSSVARARPGEGSLGPRRECADDEVVHDERRRHRGADRAVGVPARDDRAVVDDGAPAGAGLVTQLERLAAVVLTGSRPRQHASRVGEGDGMGAEDGEQVPPGSFRGVGRQAVAEVL